MTEPPKAQQTIESEVSTSHNYMNTDDDGNIITLDEYFRRNNLTDLVETDGASVSATMGKPKGISPSFLSKIWNIRNDEAVKVLEQTTHLRSQGAPNALSRRSSTNDKMLRYRRIDSVFFTDTFFVTSKGKS